MLANQIVDHIPIRGMHIDQPTMLFHLFHQSYHLPVIDHQSAFVSHEGFEGSDSLFFDHALNLFFCILVEIRDCHVKTVVTHTIIVGPRSPLI